MSARSIPRAPSLRLAHVHLSLGSFDATHAEHVSVRFPPHIHDVFAFGVIGCGANRFRYRGATSVAATGAVVAIPPGEIHTGEALTEEGWSYRMIYPSVELVRAALGSESPASGDSIFFPDAIIDAPDVARTFLAMHARLFAPSCAMARDELLITFLRTLGTRFGVGRVAPSRLPLRGHDIAAKARAYLDLHFGTSVSLLELSGVCGVSAFHLIRCFREAVGLPPHAYLKALRVSRAQCMLRSGSTISDATYTCGFSDQSHLTRTFKRVTGLSPGAYSRMVRGCPVSLA
jgi:AraC-like DNA-binding protein